MTAPAFQLYADNFVSGTIEMSQAEVGAYMRLLCHQWTRGSIPSDDEKLRRIAGGSVSEDVMAKFPVGPDGLRKNARLERVRSETTAYREKQSGNAKLAWAKRRGSNPTNGHTTHHLPTEPDGLAMPSHMPAACQTDGLAVPSHMPKPCSSSSTSSSLRGAPPPNAREGVAVELPSGFPATEDEALVASDFVGCTAEFAATEWRLAVSRGGRDSRDVTIRSWRHYLSARRDYAANRAAEQAERQASAETRSSTTHVRSSTAPITTQIRLLEEELANHPGNPGNGVGSLESKKARRPEFKALTAKLAELKLQATKS